MDAIVDEKLAKKFETEKESPYTRWVASEGLVIIAAHYVRDLKKEKLRPNRMELRMDEAHSMEFANLPSAPEQQR